PRGSDSVRSLFLEYDRGTESPGRVAAKLIGYQSVAGLSDAADLLLICFPDPLREAAVRKRLYGPGITLATASWDRLEQDPLGAIWLPIDSERRVPLLDLPITRNGMHDSYRGEVASER
ncbi:MAG: hypothetical protein ACREV8_17905, partial [Gammaproteobacteria bacterium]